jgi:cobalt-zinc-cadmium efflux system membrane fusion protein
MSPRRWSNEPLAGVFPRRVAAALVVLAVVLVGGCDGGTRAEAAAVASPTNAARRDTAFLSAEAQALAGMTIAPAESIPWRESWSVPARLTLDPAETQLLGAVAEGRVTRVLVRVGDSVRAGQLLATIHSHEMLDARSALARAAAAAAEAATTLQVAASAAGRAERLHALRALSLADLERARGELAQARSRRLQAAAELDRARSLRDHLAGGGPVPTDVDEHEVLVRAPIAGTVVSRDAQPGAVVLVGAPLVGVSRTTSLLLALHLPERALGAARPGAVVRFEVEAFPGERFTARVTRVAPMLDSLTRTVEVQAQVLDDTGRLRAEMYATAELLGPPGTPTLVVPAVAVQSLEGDTVVVTAARAGDGALLEAVRVRVGRRTAQQAEILAGLAAGTPVVVEGAAITRAEILRRRGGE